MLVPETVAEDTTDGDHGCQRQPMGGIVPVEAPSFTVAEDVPARCEDDCNAGKYPRQDLQSGG